MTNKIFISSRVRGVSLWASILSLSFVVLKEIGLLGAKDGTPLTNIQLSVFAINAFIMGCAYCQARFMPRITMNENELVFARPLFKRQAIKIPAPNMVAKISDDKISFYQADKRVFKFSLFGISDSDKLRVKSVIQKGFGSPAPA